MCNIRHQPRDVVARRAMPALLDHPPLNLRPVLESTGTPFSIARYGQRGVIFFQGDACDSVLYIEIGRVRLSVGTADGKNAICGLVEAGGFLGEEALDGHDTRPQTATAMTATQVLVVATSQMIHLLHTQHAIADRFLAHVLTRNTRLEGDLAAQLLESCEQRVARALITLAGCRDRPSCVCVLPRRLAGDHRGDGRHHTLAGERLHE